MQFLHEETSLWLPPSTVYETEARLSVELDFYK